MSKIQSIRVLFAETEHQIRSQEILYATNKRTQRGYTKRENKAENH